MTPAELAFWLEDQEWRVVVEGPNRVVAEKRILGTPHDWFVMFLQQLPGQPWTASLSRRKPNRASTSGNVYCWDKGLATAAGLDTVADAGLWLGGELSRLSPEHAA